MKYPGGKGKTFQHVINCMPPHGVYIETHLGGGAVMRHKRAAGLSIGIDIDPAVLEARKDDLGDRCELVQADATAWLRSRRFTGNELVYCDPPYLPSTRRKARLYRHELTEPQHVYLLDVLRSLCVPVILSGYRSELYDDLLPGWRTETFAAKTHAGVREETLWLNFERPDQLHDYSHLGSGFREREAIRRRLTNLKAKIDRLPPLEQEHLAAWIVTRCGTRTGC